EDAQLHSGRRILRNRFARRVRYWWQSFGAHGCVRPSCDMTTPDPASSGPPVVPAPAGRVAFDAGACAPVAVDAWMVLGPVEVSLAPAVPCWVIAGATPEFVATWTTGSALEWSAR